PRGEDVSIGFEWRASIMANSSRDPYWQASVRRETIDHGESKAAIEDECSICHMPITRYEAKLQGRNGQVFAHIPFKDAKLGKEAGDGVNCSVCHQISKEKLGTRESFNGGFTVDPPLPGNVRPEYGPFEVDAGHQQIMRSSTGGFQPVLSSEHIRQSETCGTCHTLYTKTLGPGGKVIGELPEQTPFVEWLHSSYKDKQTCQSCHMPVVQEPVPITRVFGEPREGLSRHTFVGANFFMLRMLNKYRDELEVAALPQELAAAAEGTVAFLKSSAARLSISGVRVESGQLRAEVFVDNVSGHKLPTAYPSRRAWLHVTVRDRDGRIVFESGALRPDGSIVGNDNDTDAARFEPHYGEITRSEQVQIYEDIIGDPNGRVTTGLLAGVGYLKDNRLLPHGFDKRTAGKDFAVIGEAASDPGFTDEGHRIRYAIALGDAQGPFRVEAALWYQPIGFRWANNLKPYARTAAEPQRFTRYFDAMGNATSVNLARAEFVYAR
ncbi:MAG TPA: hypothetical protein VN428_02670, partial [Bryobacteraceae bacterium]|nr:hypothetical protein [Bryobacteraceae bacterium]